MCAGRSQPSLRPHPRLLAWAACLAFAGPAPLQASDLAAPPALVPGAAVPWHASLADAHRAALVSRRPVLVVFTACSSASGAALANDVFPAEATVKLLTAGFEPVQIDIDADPNTGRTLGITRVPAACIVDAENRVLARFDCPVEPTAFVAAVTRGAEEAAVARSSGTVAPPADVRQQSDFAAAAAAPAATASSPPASAEQALTEEPALAAAPPAWPAEPAARPMPFSPDASAVAAVRPSIEPTATGTSWLAPAPAPAAESAAAATAVATTPTAAATPAQPTAAAAENAVTATAPAEPAEEKPSASKAFFDALTRPFSIFSKTTKTEPKTPATGTATPVATASAPATPAADPLGPMPLGLEGYCPVSLMDKGQWVEGRAQWGARHRGRTYLFAGAEQQRAFLTDPDRYAPALSGDDPVLACDSGRQVAGQRRYGVTYQSRMYLFSSPDTRSAFAANPQRYTTRVIIAERPSTAGTVVK